jgi:hypothetical protein
MGKAALLAVCGAAIGLHAYECFVLASSPAPGFFLWSLLPYAAAAFFFVRPNQSLIPAMAGMLVALLVDGLNHYEIFISPSGSTAALGMIFIPIWSAAVFVPLACLVTRRIVRARAAEANAL